jgi:hypothetical protein
MAFVFGAVTVLLVSGACRRQVAKYGGPPADYRDSAALEQNQHEKADSVALTEEKAKAE